MFGFTARRRAKLRATPLTDAQWTIIDRRVPYVATLSKRDRDELAGIVQILLAEKNFEGCGGLEMTDEIRITITAQAAVLLLHRETDYYPTLKSILVYPHAFVSKTRQPQPDGSVIEGPQVRLGESWFRGSLVLSWDDVVRGADDPHDGRNVVFHEFAHQLDGESGSMEGAPALDTPTHYHAWARVLSAEYNDLVNAVHLGYHTLLDPYGSTNPAEFFAVCTEMFFERPGTMKAQYPALYDQLASFYKQNPVRRS